MDKQKYRDFRSNVDQILWEEWDPIGLNDCPEARDEYTTYAGAICGKLWNGETRELILDYLFWAENECMGLGGDKKVIDEKNSKIVSKVITLFSSYQKIKFYCVIPEKLVILSVATFGFYCWYWIYQNWKNIRELHRVDYSPLVRTWLFFPFNFQLFKAIKEYAEANKLKVDWSPSTLSIIFNLFLIGWFFPYTLFISIFIGVCIIPINLTCGRLNTVQGFRESFEGFKSTDGIVIIIGGILVANALLNKMEEFLRNIL